MEINRKQLSKDLAYRRAIFVELCQPYQHEIYGYCVRMLGKTYGEEVAQEVFLRAFEALPKLRDFSDSRAWLFGIARRQCARVFRSPEFQHHSRNETHDNFPSQVPSHTPCQTSQASIGDHDKENQLALVEAFLAKLSDYEQLLFRLRFMKGMSYKEIAEVSGKRPAALRKRMQRIRDRIKEYLTDASQQ